MGSDSSPGKGVENLVIPLTSNKWRFQGLLGFKAVDVFFQSWDCVFFHESFGFFLTRKKTADLFPPKRLSTTIFASLSIQLHQPVAP
jgi:hypothetical protein